MNLQKTIFIKSDRNSVWTAITELEEIKKWNTCLVNERYISEGEPRVGFEFIIEVKEGSKVVEYESKITEYQLGNKMNFQMVGKSLGKNPMNVGYTLLEEDAGTQIIQTISWQPHGIILFLFSPIITLISKKNITNDLVAIKSHLESEDS